MFRPTTRRGLIALAVTLALTVVPGCSLLGGSQGAEPGGGEGGGTEKSSITVSIMPTTDLAPLHLAMERGYFEKAGLKVSTVNAPSGSDSVTMLASGDVDIAYASYTPIFAAEAKGVVPSGIKLVGGASVAGPESTGVVALPASKITDIEDLEGKKVTVTATGTMCDLMIMSAMKSVGADPSSVQWVKSPFPDMAKLLKAGDADAAFFTEPFITLADSSIGAELIVDLAAGPTADLPTAGYAATGDFAKDNPETVATFQQVMRQATEEALADRSAVGPLLEKFSKVDPKTAEEATLLDFTAEMDPAEIQRVPDLMLEFDALPEKIDVSTMVVQ